jgi:hypothetical protein
VITFSRVVILFKKFLLDVKIAGYVLVPEDIKMNKQAASEGSLNSRRRDK